MTKVSISITLDSDVIDLIPNKNKSSVINRILKSVLQSETALNEEITEYERIIAQLKKQINRNKNWKEDIPKGLIKDIKGYIEIDPERNEIPHPGVGEILKRSPDKLLIWTEVINKRYGTIYTPDQFKQIVERWKDG